MAYANVLTLEDIVAKTTDLPSLSGAAMAVMREADSPNSTAEGMARALGSDPALAAQVLRLANSAFYGMPRRVASVPQSIMILGTRAVRNLALVAATFPWLSRPIDGYALGPGQLWAHALGTAVGATLIAERSRKAQPDLAFTAGLLHDIGKLAMSVWLERKLPALLKIAELEGTPFDAVERRVLGFDHTEVGAHLGENWNLPAELTAPMRWHHRPDEAPSGSPLVDCVHIADYLSMAMGLGIGGDGLRYELSENALHRLDLLPEDLTPIADEFVDRYERQARAFEESRT
ncbi:MAG: HDOD domain-containing protein [Fimbriimonas sp.]